MMSNLIQFIGWVCVIGLMLATIGRFKAWLYNHDPIIGVFWKEWVVYCGVAAFSLVFMVAWGELAKAIL